jgi:signal transduction histidine kinase
VHKLLERQLKKCFGSEAPADPRFARFLDAVDAAYQTSDMDRAMLERSIELASTEMHEQNLSLSRDLTEIKRLEVELRKAERLRAVGQLAAGIAHEINTPIQFLGDSVHFLKSAFADLLKVVERGRELCAALDSGQDCADALRGVHEVAEDVELQFVLTEVPHAFEQTTEGIRRVAQIVAAMKAFGHPDAAEKVLADVNRCIDTTLTVARNELKYVADVELALEPLPEVWCFPGELNQVLLNLLVNAAHAVAARWGEQQKRGHVWVSSARVGDDVVIAIKDDGSGIDEALRSRIFEPFFTTKAVGKGTGQGLPIARSIVQKHGGTLSFESRLGEGSCFTIRIPIAAEGAAGAAIEGEGPLSRAPSPTSGAATLR